MDNYKEYERNKQKMNIKELNGMNTLDEQTKELMLVLDEFISNTSPDTINNLIEESDREDIIIKKVIGDSYTLPLVAIEKLLPFIETLFSKAHSDTSDKTIISLLNHACDDMATCSKKLVPDGAKIPSDKTFELSEVDALSLDKEALVRKWDECFKGILEQIKEAIKQKDNIMICSHCYHLWSISNISAIFF